MLDGVEIMNCSRYGFDPHDFSHHFTIEDNESFANGNHGFIISRGCNNFTIRNNKSYNNFDASETSQAHGFMLDPGSPNSVDPQASSYDNILENNEAYGNEGYGVRILGSMTGIDAYNWYYARGSDWEAIAPEPPCTPHARPPAGDPCARRRMRGRARGGRERTEVADLPNGRCAFGRRPTGRREVGPPRPIAGRVGSPGRGQAGARTVLASAGPR